MQYKSILFLTRFKCDFMELISCDAVKLNDWFVKASIVNGETICIILYHDNSERTIIKYFDDEEKAYIFVNALTSKMISDESV